MNVAERLDRLESREAIRECLHRYCRGVDRVDPELVRSAYWPDAHGAYQGGPDGLADAVVKGYSTTDHVVHAICNTGIQPRENQADVEAYFIAYHATETDEYHQRIQTFLAGRYLDVFERREGEWKILQRTVVYDWIHKAPLPAGLGPSAFAERTPVGQHSPHDLVYRLFSTASAATSADDRYGPS